MALYDPVSGVYRKVSKKYDPVNGVYRKVKAAYDPVDGVHRKYFSSEVPWTKYKCVRDEYEDYSISGPHAVASGTDASKSFTGYEGYEYDDDNGIVYGVGEQKTADINNTSVFVYIIIDDRTVHECWVVSNGRWTIREWSVGCRTIVEYYIRTLVGTVLVADGEYPDENLGYTYVDVYDGYTIMQDPDGNYYAYLLEEE